MTQTGFNWFCKKCGFEYYGEEAPEECPTCGADKEEFYETPE